MGLPFNKFEPCGRLAVCSGGAKPLTQCILPLWELDETKSDPVMSPSTGNQTVFIRGNVFAFHRDAIPQRIPLLAVQGRMKS